MAQTSQVASLQAEETLAPRLHSPIRDFMIRLWASPSARVGGFLVVVFTVISILVPLLDNYDALRDRNLRATYAQPDCVFSVVRGEATLSDMECRYPFGADKNGRSIFQRVGHGMSVSLMAGVFVVVLAVTAGSAIGLSAGYLGGWVDSLFMRFMDVMFAFPSLLLAIVVVTIAGPGLRNGMFAVAITQIPIYARLARSMAISLRSQEFVTAARSVGANDWLIIRRHIFPNSLAPLIVQATLGLGTAVVETAALGFLGLGQKAPFPELGKMLADSQRAMLSGMWWVMFFPGAAIILMVLGFNLFGDGLRDTLDPRLRGSR